MVASAIWPTTTSVAPGRATGSAASAEEHQRLANVHSGCAERRRDAEHNGARQRHQQPEREDPQIDAHFIEARQRRWKQRSHQR